MTTSKQSLCPTRIESNSQPASTQYSGLSGLLIRLKTISHTLIRWLTTQPELTVKQKVDRFGNAYWYIYDPATQRSTCLTSENAVRIWIEEWFCHQTHNAHTPGTTDLRHPFR